MQINFNYDFNTTEDLIIKEIKFFEKIADEKLFSLRQKFIEIGEVRLEDIEIINKDELILYNQIQKDMNKSKGLYKENLKINDALWCNKASSSIDEFSNDLIELYLKFKLPKTVMDAILLLVSSNTIGFKLPKNFKHIINKKKNIVPLKYSLNTEKNKLLEFYLKKPTPNIINFSFISLSEQLKQVINHIYYCINYY